MSATPSHDDLAPFAFAVDVAKEVLDDLRARLKATRFAPDPENEDEDEDETYGLSTAVLRPLVEYWADCFDRRAAEAGLNGLRQYRLDVGGTPVHFVHERGKGPVATRPTHSTSSSPRCPGSASPRRLPTRGRTTRAWRIASTP